MQCISSKSGEVGPVVYCHWSGRRAPYIVRRLAARMKGREGDLSYSSARLVQEAIGMNTNGNISFGVWNSATKLVPNDSHGDAGCVVIDVDNGHKCECFGGYLSVAKDGFPTVDADEDEDAA